MPTQITASQISDLGQSINARTTKYVATKAAGVALATGLPDGVVVIVEADESQGGVRVRYTVASGVLAAGVVDTAVMSQFTQAGTGAVARTAQDKMREVPASAQDYGSLPNSGVDEFARLNNAVTNHRIVELEEGVYLVTRGLRQTLNGAVLRGKGKNKTILRAMSPTGNGKFGGTDGSEGVVWAMAPEGSPLYGLRTEDLTIDCAGLETGAAIPVLLKGHHYRRVHDFKVDRVSVKDCGSYAFWANDKPIEDGGTITGCSGEYNDCSAYDAEISFETTGRCSITYNRPRAEQTRASWGWPILEQYHFYGGDGLITVNDGYAKCRSSTIIGPLLTQKNVIFNGGYYEQLDTGTTAINMGTSTGNYDNWNFNDVVVVAAGQVGAISFGGLGSANAKMTLKGGSYTALSGTSLTFTAIAANAGSVDMVGVNCKSTQVGAAVPFSLIVTGTFKGFQVFGGSQEAFGPAVGASPVNAPSAKFSNVQMTPSSSVTKSIRQSYQGAGVFADGGGFAQLNLAIPLNVLDINKVVATGVVKASATSSTGAGEGVAYTFNNPSANIINFLAPSVAIGRTFNYIITEYD